MTKVAKPLFTPRQITANMNESIGNTTIFEAISRNHSMLRDHFFESLLNLDAYTQLLEGIRAVTENTALQAELESQWRNEKHHPNEEINILLQHVRYACLYLELATTAEKQESRDRAWAFTNYASVMIGEIIEKSAAILNAREAENRAERNSKNAKGRIKNFLPVKEEAVRLLEEMKPEDGSESGLRGYRSR